VRNNGEKIVVVGAGFAGLTAAREIIKETMDRPNMRLMIIEAEKNIGGRAKSINHSFGAGGREHNFTAVGYGAYWLTGSDGPRSATGLNPENGAAHVLAKRAGIVDFDLVDRINNKTPKNHTYIPLESNERMSSRWQTFKKACSDEAAPVWYAAESNRNKRPFDESLRKEVQKKVGLSYKEFWTFFHDYNGQISGEDPKDTWAGAYYEGVAATNDQVLKRGFAPMYDFLRDEIIDLVKKKNKSFNESKKTVVKFKMQHKVTKIQKRAKMKVFVQTNSGALKKINADKVVLTVSVNVLKSKSFKFSPKLPSKHTDALKALGMGFNSKTILFYTNRFWDKKIPRNVRSQKIIIMTDKKSTVNGFSKIWVHPTQNFVMLIKHGDAASNCEIQPDECADEAKVFMKTAFGDDIPDPIAITNSKWGQNENYLGAWSYLKSGMIKTSDKTPIPNSYQDDLPRIWNTSGGYSLDRLTMGQSPEGEWEDALFFAGEATSLTVPGYVHGAIESGKRVATDICKN